MLKLSSLKIDPEFSAQILPLSFEELQQLEMNMIRDGKLTDPIIVWNKTATTSCGSIRLSNMRSKKWSFPAVRKL